MACLRVARATVFIDSFGMADKKNAGERSVRVGLGNAIDTGGIRAENEEEQRER